MAAQATTKGAKAAVELKRALAHGLANGGIRAATGGNFWHGSASGSLSSLSGSYLQTDDFAGNLVVASVVGGATEQIAGGNFSDGAITGAYTYLFNHAAGEFFGPSARLRKQTKKFIKELQEQSPDDGLIPKVIEGFSFVNRDASHRVPNTYYRINTESLTVLILEFRSNKVIRTTFDVVNGFQSISAPFSGNYGLLDVAHFNSNRGFRQIPRSLASDALAEGLGSAYTTFWNAFTNGNGQLLTNNLAGAIKSNIFGNPYKNTTFRFRFDAGNMHHVIDLKF